MRSVLVVDDNFDNRQVFRFALDALQLVVEEADGGESALALLGSRRFDLMILDLQMPVVSGNVVLRRMKDLPGCRDTMVLVVTANSHFVTSEIEELSHFVMYKPFDVKQFMLLVRRILPLEAVS